MFLQEGWSLTGEQGHGLGAAQTRTLLCVWRDLLSSEVLSRNRTGDLNQPLDG